MIDPSIYNYISQSKTFDVGYWYEYNDGFMLLPYKGGRWLSDKIWFSTFDELKKFCQKCECAVIKHSNED